MEVVCVILTFETYLYYHNQENPMSLRLLLLSPSVFLLACSVGLDINTSLEDTANIEEPGSEPTTDPIDTDSDTDTQDTQDTEDTEDLGDLIPNLITSLSPAYGTTAGGTTISIMGGPFTSDATVSFGENQGVVLSNNGSMIRVNTPSVTEGGAVEVRVVMDDGYGTSTEPYIYFEDSLGQAASIGIISYVEYVGSYWNGGVSPDPMASAWTAFTNPIDFHWWEFSTPTLDTCEKNQIDSDGNGSADDINGDGSINGDDFYQFSGTLTVIDIGSEQLNLNSGSSTISLNRASSDPSLVDYYLYESSGTLDPTTITPNAFFDLEISDGPLAGLIVPQYGRASKPSEPFFPALNSSSPPYVTSSQTFNWSPSSADWVEIRLYQLNSLNYVESDIICNVSDSGSFSIQNIHHTWTYGNPIYIQFTRVFESDTTLPQNDGESRIIGSHTIFGAGLMD